MVGASVLVGAVQGDLVVLDSMIVARLHLVVGSDIKDSIVALVSIKDSIVALVSSSIGMVVTS